VTVPERTDPAFSETHDRDRFALDQRFFHRGNVMLGRCANPVRRLPSGVFGPNLSRTDLILLGNFFPLRLFGIEKGLQLGCFRAQFLVFPGEFPFLQACANCAAACEDGFGLHVGELEPLDHYRLGLILVADDANEPHRC